MSDTELKKRRARVGTRQRALAKQLGPLAPEWRVLLVTPPANDNATPIPDPHRPGQRPTTRR
jgi:hypothetical protein